MNGRKKRKFMHCVVLRLLNHHTKIKHFRFNCWHFRLTQTRVTALSTVVPKRLVALAMAKKFGCDSKNSERKNESENKSVSERANERNELDNNCFLRKAIIGSTFEEKCATIEIIKYNFSFSIMVIIIISMFGGFCFSFLFLRFFYEFFVVYLAVLFVCTKRQVCRFATQPHF